MTESIPSAGESPASPTEETGEQKTKREKILRLLAQEIMVLLKEELRHDLERQGRGR